MDAAVKDPQFVRNTICREERLRLFVYDDATGQPIKPGYTVVGHPTIGWGRALDVHGVSPAEADLLMDADVSAAIAGAVRFVPGFGDLTVNRQAAVVSMVYNLGIDGFMGFKKLIAALREKNFSAAADEMQNSHWAVQVPERARELVPMMRVG